MSFGRRALLGGLLAAAFSMTTEAQQDRYARERQAMVDTVAAIARETQRETGRAALSERVLAAMGKVPRHKFVPPAEERYAYHDRPLPIGDGQTISQPFIVALMTDLLELEAGDKVLEVGTGSGYQAAVLAELAHSVYTIEIVPQLGQEANTRLAALGYRNVATRVGDGYQGWAEHAPFDAIMVTAGAAEIPSPLIEQMKPGGRMVIPVGPQWWGQDLQLIAKDKAGGITRRSVLAVRFVPLTGGPRAAP